MTQPLVVQLWTAGQIDRRPLLGRTTDRKEPSMNTPISKIRAGLDARENNQTFRFSGLENTPTSLAQLNDLASKATENLSRLGDIKNAVDGAVEKERAALEKNFASVQDKIQRRKLIDDAVKDYRKSASEFDAEERVKLLAEIDSAEQSLRQVKESFIRPIAVLMTTTRNSPERQRYSANLVNAGPVEIETAMRDATLLGDKALAAACSSRIDGMDKSSRRLVRYNRNEMAEKLCGKECLDAAIQIANIEIAKTKGEILRDQTLGKSIASTRKIKVGIMKQDRDALIEQDASPETD